MGSWRHGGYGDKRVMGSWRHGGFGDKRVMGSWRHGGYGDKRVMGSWRHGGYGDMGSWRHEVIKTWSWRRGKGHLQRDQSKISQPADEEKR